MSAGHLITTVLVFFLTSVVSAQIPDPGFEGNGSGWSTCYTGSSIEQTTDVPLLGGNHVLSLDAHHPYAQCYGPDGFIPPFHFWELFGYPNGTTVTFSFWAKRADSGLTTPDPVVFHLVFGKMTSVSTFTYDANVPGSNVFQQVTDEWVHYEYSCLVTGLGPGEPLAILLGANYSSTYNLLWVDNIGITAPGSGAALVAGAWLGGAMDTGTGLMRDDLRASGLIPLTEPYSAVHGGPGGETVAPPILAVTGPDAVVDWVRIELRSDPTAEQPLAVRHALIQRDGDIVSATGTSPVQFPTGTGNYFVTIRHRNHLPVISAQALFFGSSSAVFNTRSTSNGCGVLPFPWTDLPQQVDGTYHMQWSGDVNFDGVVKYAGSANDRDAILQAIGGGTPTNTVSNVYDRRDVNLDGSIKYTGAANDRDVILQTIGGSVPTATRTQQLP